MLVKWYLLSTLSFLHLLFAVVVAPAIAHLHTLALLLLLLLPLELLLLALQLPAEVLEFSRRVQAIGLVHLLDPNVQARLRAVALS